MIQRTHNIAHDTAIWWSNNSARYLIIKHITAKAIHQIRQQVAVAPRGHIIDNSNLFKSAPTISHQTVLEMCFPKLGYEVLKKNSSLSSDSAGIKESANSICITLGCSCLILYLFDLKLTSLPHILIQVNRQNWSTSIIWFWIYLQFLPVRCNSCYF